MHAYQVLIHWSSCDSDFSVPVISHADTPEEAARKRVALLGTPSNYTKVLVLSPLGKDAWVYPVQQFVDRGTKVRQPRYGWRG